VIIQRILNEFCGDDFFAQQGFFEDGNALEHHLRNVGQGF
jgi:hypothetical protein